MTTPWRRGGALVLLGALVSGCGFSLQSFPKIGGPSGPSYPIHAQFTNVLNLPADAQVRDGSAVVGTVTSISTHDFIAEVTLAIRSDVHLPLRTTAQVRFDSPLGDEYVLLTPPSSPSGPPLREGAVIGVVATTTAPSIENTLTALGAVLDGGGIDQLQTIVVELNKTFGGNQGQIRNLLSQLAVALKSLAAHTGDIETAIAAVGTLAAELNARRDTITSGIDTIAPAVGVLAKENGDLRTLLTQLVRLSRTTNAIVTASGQDSINDAHDLVPVVNQLVGVERRVGPDLADIATFEAQTPKIAPGDYLQVALTLHAKFNSGPVDADEAVATTGPATGAAAITELLDAGLP